jgi:hypothetical protein
VGANKTGRVRLISGAGPRRPVGHKLSITRPARAATPSRAVTAVALNRVGNMGMEKKGRMDRTRTRDCQGRPGQAIPVPEGEGDGWERKTFCGPDSAAMILWCYKPAGRSSPILFRGCGDGSLEHQRYPVGTRPEKRFTPWETAVPDRRAVPIPGRPPDLPRNTAPPQRPGPGGCRF